MYPIGFLSLLTYLGKRGFKVRILNLAARMLMDQKYDSEKAIRTSEAKVYGVDLHWLIHVQGAIEIAKLVKKYHSNRPVVFGGLSSTLFWRDILKNYASVDFIVLGDTAEKPFEMLLNHILDGKRSLEDTPNLAWRENGKLKTTGIKWVPENLDEYSIDYGFVIKESLKSGDFLSQVPFAKFLSEPIAASLAFKGCIYNCITCGGSKFTYEKFLNRNRLAVKSPEKIAEEIISLQEYMKIPVFILGDLQLLGNRKVELLSKLLHESKIDSTLFFEFFKPPSKSILAILKKASTRVILQISPESHEEHVRFAFGRMYGNDQLIHFIRNAVELGFKRLDLYFMIGLPKQTLKSAVETPLFLEKLISEIPGCRDMIDSFIAPLAPFIDPGSHAYSNPKLYGYKLLFRSLEEHRRAIESAKSWKHALNYETTWMSKEEIAKATYEAAERMIHLKVSYGIIREEDGLKTIEMIREARKLVELDEPETEPSKLLTVKETVSRGDLYPTKKLILSLRPKFLIALLEGLVRK